MATPCGGGGTRRRDIVHSAASLIVARYPPRLAASLTTALKFPVAQAYHRPTGIVTSSITVFLYGKTCRSWWKVGSSTAMSGRVPTCCTFDSFDVSGKKPSGASTLNPNKSRPTSLSTLVPQAGVAVSVPTKLSVSV